MQEAHVVQDAEGPLTDFQEQIASLETEALSNPESISSHIALLRALLEGNEYQGLAKYYETIALGDGPNTEGRDVLVASDEAWGLYVEALARSGRLAEVAAKVRRRDQVINPSSTTSTASSASPIPTAALSTGSAATAQSTSPPTPTPSRPAILGPMLSSTSSQPSPASSPAPAAAGASQPFIGGGGATGTPLSPIYVQMAPPTPQMSLLKGLRWFAVMMLWSFIILTILAMVFENAGLLKAGRGPAEFEPEEGKIVKFADVHGCEEAKGVSFPVHHESLQR